MKCRECGNTFRKTNKDRIGLCKRCFDFEKKWVKESMKFIDIHKKRRA
jgi:hypothetical protein